MKKIMLVLLVSMIGTFVQAQEKKDKKNKNAKVEFKVAGNCEMCKKRIETAAFGVKGVKSAVWNVDEQEMFLILDENKCTKEAVAKAIAAVGHDTEFEKATNAVYEELHGCCQYERMK